MPIDRDVLEARLREYFREVLGDERKVIVGDRLSGGWSVDTFGITADNAKLVVRVAGPGHPLNTDPAREARVMQRVAVGGVPVPSVLCTEEDPSWLGGPFSIVEFVPGTAPNVWSRRRMGGILRGSTPQKLIGQLIDVASKVATLDAPSNPSDLPSKLGLVGEGYTVAGDCQRWLAMLEETDVRRPALSLAGRWLSRNAPPTREVVFQHHDFRLGNVLVAEDGEITAVLDWEFCGAGDPLCDIGYAAQPYSLGRLLRTVSSLDLAPDPTSWMLEEFLRRSVEPVDRARLAYFLALGIFKMAVALVLTADEWWRGRGEYWDAWLELPILSLSEDLITAIKRIS